MNEDQIYLGVYSGLETQHRINLLKDVLYGAAEQTRRGESVLEASHKLRGLRGRQYLRKRVGE